MSDIRGITLNGSEITGRAPIGAALSVGIKGANGQPINKDRFYVAAPVAHSQEYSKRDGGTYKSDKRDLHPAFAGFNDDAKTEPERRRAIPIRIMHAHEWDSTTKPPNGCFWYGYQAHTLDKRRHPRNAPMCTGNGVHAERWNGKEIQAIECLGLDRCPYTLPGKAQPGQKPPKPECGMKMHFVARFDWPRTDGKGLPNIPFAYKSGGRNMVHGFVGFFDEFRRVCADVGVPYASVSLVGFPAMLMLAEKTNKEEGTRYPVVSLVPRFEETDILGWIGQQATRIAQLQAQYAPEGVPLLTTDDGYDLFSASTAGSIPS